MEKKIALSIEQMKHLESLGIDGKKDATLCWIPDKATYYEHYYLGTWDDNVLTNRYIIPAYTLQDILEKLPHEIFCGEGVRCGCYTLSIDGWEGENFNITYINRECHFIEVEFIGNILDSLYKMLVWLIEKGHVKTNKV